MTSRPNEDAQAEFLRTHPEAAKPSNPKDAFGSAKVPVGLAPDTALQEMALAFLEGATKYGRYNWRVVGVRASIYNDAMERHRMKWWNGQDRDPVTRVRELASVMACCAILIDSEICGVLNDDRPPMAPLGQLLDINMEVVAHLKDLFKDHSPVQYTIEDTPGLVRETPPEPEGFPMGYDANAGDPEGRDPHDHVRGYTLMTETDLHLASQAAGASTVHEAQLLFLECGCTKRCKGHPVSLAAAAVDLPPNGPVCVAAGPKDPSGRPYASTTADAEFPQPPPDYRIPASPREFDPAD